MKAVNLKLLLLPALLAFSLYITGCENSAVETTDQTDDEYLQSTAINSAFSGDQDDEDNLFTNEAVEFDSDGPVADFGSGTGDTPIDSLLRWGRKVTSVNISANISFSSDTMKTVEVTRTISGNFYIIGYVAGVRDSTVKPYTQQQKRSVSFKKIGNGNHPRLRWRVYQFTAIDGQTTSPQMGKDNITMSSVQVYVNNNLALTLNGPDFTQNIFTAKLFTENRILKVNAGDEVRVKVSLTSNQVQPDIVAFHWARNSFGFHRERFAMTSQVQNGTNFDRVYEKTFNIYNNHRRGIFNGFISANTNSSLYDNNTSLFSSTYMGIPYRVR